MEISGKVKTILAQQTFGSGFTKRELVITTQEQYPQHLLVEFVQDKVALLANLSVGDEVTVSINLRGREWQAPDGTLKYFNSIQGWRLEKANARTAMDSVPPPSFEDMETPGFSSSEEEMDDLPF